ncbi:hypothetical protein COBT_003184, partial [Conglomerata obtusa]
TYPYIIKFGRLQQFGIDVELNLPIKFVCRKDASENRNKHRFNYKSKYITKGKRNYKSNFSLGEKVFVYKEQPIGKMTSIWQEGFTIMEKVHDTAYIVTDRSKFFRANIKHLKRQEG